MKTLTPFKDSHGNEVLPGDIDKEVADYIAKLK